MSNTTPADIRAAIVKAIQDNITKAGAVYGYNRSTFDAFPAVVVIPEDDENKVSSTNSSRDDFMFKVLVYYDIPEEGEHDDAEAALDEIYGELLELFQNRSLLGDVCEWCYRENGTWGYEERNNGIFRFVEFTVHAVKYLRTS